MKYVKTFEGFQVNEELSLKGLAPIIASLFLTFNSFDASAIMQPTVMAIGGGSSSRQYARYVTNEIRTISDKIKKDLERLKLETQDPELLRLIESVQSLNGWSYSNGMDKVNIVVNDLKNYIQSQNINERLVNDTLNNLSSGDVELIESDYQMLLQKYQEIDTHTGNMALILIIVSTLVLSFAVFVGIRTYQVNFKD
jgi:hypothetical protein